MRNRFVLVAVQLLVAAGCGVTGSQPDASEAPAPKASSSLQLRAAVVKHTGRELPANTYVERLVVKFHEGSHVRLRGNRVLPLSAERGAAERALLLSRGLDEARIEASVKAAQALLERAPRAGALSRVFQEDEDVLAARKASGEARSGRQLADLNLYFEVLLMPGTTAGGVADLVASLNALESVEVAYAQPRPELTMVAPGMSAAMSSLLAATDIPPTTPSFEGTQGHLDAAPRGIDARFAWSVPGGNGSGVKVVDIEGSWRITHEDLPNLFYQGGVLYDNVAHRNHGTAVLGIIAAPRNGYGVEGIAHGASVGVEAIYYTTSLANHISTAAAQVGRGGVILIEFHFPGTDDGSPCTCNQDQCHYVAAEYWQAEFDAIATATASGVVVVEASGNGSSNLDAAAYANRFNRAVRDSGAILVGASNPVTREPACYTNFGSRVDVHGWGDYVITLGYGDLFNGGSEDQLYTRYFSGTSSASAMVTGAVASVQGAALASGRGALSPSTMRYLLLGTGTPQASDSRQIGPLPDLRQALLTNPIDRSEFFIRQTYRDVLRREVDASGYGFYLNLLQSCNGNSACLAANRLTIARGLLESAENRQQDPDLNPASPGYNSAYVTHCYTNFLQRQPSASEHSWWLNNLNTGGDYNVIVNSFITSTEYRRRFGMN
ncbi:DUF4214 domain-containing protein [Archangium lipolyticum]|uniref:DUF4214 domain-containing protein n=1 Tax=Archangium lipolyticum TaxID=2970465 RepID=UPI002149C534|nr:DUF4214 domain-containing protein [Archangium lipolyticum]